MIYMVKSRGYSTRWAVEGMYGKPALSTHRLPSIGSEGKALPLELLKEPNSAGDRANVFRSPLLMKPGAHASHVSQ